MNYSSRTLSLCDPVTAKRCSRSPPPQSLAASTRKRKSSDNIMKRHFDSEGGYLRNENASLQPNRDPMLQWQRAFSTQMTREIRKTKNDVFLLCPDYSCRPFEMLVGADESSQEALEESQCLEPASPASPTTFRELASKAHDNESSNGNGFSPTGVDSHIHFWQRSMAFSDDEDESDDDSSCDSHSAKDICNHLSFPKMLVKEFANRVDVQKAPERSHRLRRPRRNILQQEQPHHRTDSLDIFRAPDPADHTSEIFWEEKVFNAEDLEKIAKLSID
jgi:hypothetical protein